MFLFSFQTAQAQPQDANFGKFAPPKAKDTSPKNVKKYCGDKPCSFNTDFGGRQMEVQPPGVRGGREVDINSAIRRSSSRTGRTRVPNARRVPSPGGRRIVR